MDAADAREFLRVPPSNRLEQLRGDRQGPWSIRINNQRRLCFNTTPQSRLNVQKYDELERA
ncbi:MAG: type II toxin-antitoxin system RelE/ParE family toxin [Thiohalocapsa sp.]